eukprot:648337-Amphidinium_carterae.1
MRSVDLFAVTHHDMRIAEAFPFRLLTLLAVVIGSQWLTMHTLMAKQLKGSTNYFKRPENVVSAM